MRYFKITKRLKEILGARKIKDIKGVFMSAEMQMFINDEIITYGRIDDENLFASNKFITSTDYIIFSNLEEALMDIENNYVEILSLDSPVKLQLDLQLSKKAEILDYDPNSPIDSQYNLKKIKESNMGGIKIISKKAKLS